MRRTALCLLALFLVGCNADHPTSTPSPDKKMSLWPPLNCTEVTQAYVPQAPGEYSLDFSLVSDGPRYHVVHINGATEWTDRTDPRGGQVLGHAFTYNFDTWYQQPNIDPRYFGDPASDDDGWSSEHAWAPHVYKENGTYYMFYTGVEYDDADLDSMDVRTNLQAIGLQTSTDLMNWTPHDGVDGTGKLLDPSGVSWLTWNDDPVWGSGDCRDPFVFKDGDTYTMLVVSRLATGGQAISYLTSDSLDSGWTWQGHLPFTLPHAGGWGPESPCLAILEGKYYLFWTEAHYGPPWDDHIPHFAVADTFGPDSFVEYPLTDQFGYGVEITISENGGWPIYSALVDGTVEFGLLDYRNKRVRTLTDCHY